METYGVDLYEWLKKILGLDLGEVKVIIKRSLRVERVFVV